MKKELQRVVVFVSETSPRKVRHQSRRTRHIPTAHGLQRNREHTKSTITKALEVGPWFVRWGENLLCIEKQCGETREDKTRWNLREIHLRAVQSRLR